MRCPCCTSKKIVDVVDEYAINSSRYNSKSHRSYEFKHHPRYCIACGHIFNASPPPVDDLNQYYSDKFSYVAEDYCSQKRLKLIEQFKKRNFRNFLDIGGNSRQSFHCQLENQGWSVDILDVNSRVNERKNDIVAAYFVFEHLVNLDECMIMASNMLRDDGSLIIEVPDSTLYENEHSGLMCEHQQHFQRSSLAKLCARYGLIERQSSHEDCSRDFGFVSVFEKSNKRIALPSVSNEVLPYFREARKKQIAEDEDYPKKYFTGQFENSKIIVFWGVNSHLEKISRAVNLNFLKKIAIDLNPEKASLVIPHFDFYTPSEFFSKLSGILVANKVSISEVSFVVTATAYYASIKKQLSTISNRIQVYDPTGKVND